MNKGREEEEEFESLVTSSLRNGALCLSTAYAERDSEPLDDEFGENKTTEAIKELISASYLDGNGKYMGPGHICDSPPPQQLRNGGNSVSGGCHHSNWTPRSSRKKKWLTRLKMRKAPRNQGFS